MADIFGRRAALLAAIALMVLGSAICTGAPTAVFGLLALGRGIQGIGAAGINVVTRMILSDGVSLKEYSKNFSTFSYLGGIGYGVGPFIGGVWLLSLRYDSLLTDVSTAGYLARVNWRWYRSLTYPSTSLGLWYLKADPVS
jgi:MFS family permease